MPAGWEDGEAGETGELEGEGGEEGFFEGDSVTVSTDSLRVKLDATQASRNESGALVFPGVVIAKEMVQVYKDAAGKEVKVYKPADSLKAILEHGENRPVTDEHPKEMVVTKPGLMRGFINNLQFTDAKELKADITITCPRLAKEIIDSKKDEVSIGFYSEQTKTPGTFNDTDYDEVQNNMWLDHVAMTTAGRCSKVDGCGITPKVKSVVIRVGGDSKRKIPQAPVVTDSESDMVKLAKQIINDKKVDLIASITQKSDAMSEEQLKALSYEELKRMDSMLPGASTMFGINKDSRKQEINIDSAYNK